MKHLRVDELKQWLEQGDVFLVDVREDYEHEAFNIGGELIPLGELGSNAAAIPKDRPVVFYCRKGVRSQIAIQRLEEKFGYTNLYNLRGGLQGWDQ